LLPTLALVSGDDFFNQLILIVELFQHQLQHHTIDTHHTIDMHPTVNSATATTVRRLDAVDEADRLGSSWVHQLPAVQRMKATSISALDRSLPARFEHPPDFDVRLLKKHRL
jgi:predicted glycoside hydrolase/deacetylase ChbG (UPF0249 family)